MDQPKPSPKLSPDLTKMVALNVTLPQLDVINTAIGLLLATNAGSFGGAVLFNELGKLALKTAGKDQILGLSRQIQTLTKAANPEATEIHILSME